MSFDLNTLDSGERSLPFGLLVSMCNHTGDIIHAFTHDVRGIRARMDAATRSGPNPSTDTTKMYTFSKVTSSHFSNELIPMRVWLIKHNNVVTK